jgi:hypothetical protein
VPLCPDLRPGTGEDQFDAINEAREVRVTGWGYSVELGHYWVTGKNVDKD